MSDRFRGLAMRWAGVTLGSRFWAKVRKGASCWEWTASTDLHGYGRLSYQSKPDKAHRVSWRLHFGEIPEGLCVLHRCDNPPCVNPAHLFLGTKKDNTHDMMNKGRAVQHIVEVQRAKIRCPKGHEYTTRPNGWRLCLICKKEWSRLYHLQKRAAR